MGLFLSLHEVKQKRVKILRWFDSFCLEVSFLKQTASVLSVIPILFSPDLQLVLPSHHSVHRTNTIALGLLGKAK